MSRINYDLSLLRGFAFDIDGVLSPVTIPVTPEGHPMRMTNMRDSLAINRAITLGFHIVVISGARASGIETRLSDLGIPEVYMHVADKASVLTDWMDRHGLCPEQVAYAGDDIPDIAPMSLCGLRVAPLDADQEIKAVANYISPCRGGDGVARDIIEQTLRSQELWPPVSNGTRSL